MSFRRCSLWAVVAWAALLRPGGAVLSPTPARDALVLRAVESSTLTDSQAAAAATDAGHAQNASRASAPQHVLRVCNAYPDTGALKIRSSGRELTSYLGLGYKSCQEWTGLQLRAGDVLEFRLGGVSAGALRLARVPWERAVVAVVVYDVIRMTGRSFASQVFQAGVPEPQLAVFDAFRGGAQAKTWIKDVGLGEHARSEELHYNEAVAIQQGRYKLYLHADQGPVLHQTPFVALGAESYMVVRCGGEGPSSERAQELLVFPVSDVSGLYAPATAAPQSIDLPELQSPFPEPTKWDPPRARGGMQGAPMELESAVFAGAMLIFILTVGLMLHALQAP